MRFKKVKILFAFMLFILCMSVFAEDMQISTNLYEDIMDLSLQKFPRKNINGELCVLIKINTSLTNLNFPDSDITDVVQKEGEVWLYVSEGKKFLSITKSGFARFEYILPIRVESGRVYKLKLEQKFKGTENLLKDTFNLSFLFNETDVIIIQNNDTQIRSIGNSARFKLAKGTYTFKFAKNGFKDIIKEINLTKDHYEEINLERGYSNTRFKLPSLVIINSDPVQADIYLDHQRIGITPFQGEILAGDHQLILQHPLYETYSARFSVEEGQSLTLPDIKMNPRFAKLTLTSQPDMADVYIDDKLIGKTPLLKKEILTDSKKLKIVSPLYKDYNTDLSLKPLEDKIIFAQLESNFGEISLYSKPENGASIYLNNEKIGETPLFNYKMVQGVHNLTMKKDWWLDEDFTVEIETGKKTEKTVILNKNFSQITIIADQSAIYINDEFMGKNQYPAKLKSGHYTITAKRKNYYDEIKQCNVYAGRDEIIELHPQPIMGSFSLVTEPKETQGASIFINSVKQEKVSPAIIPLQIGDYDVKVTFPGYVDKTERITIRESESKNLKLTLQLKNIKYLNRSKAWETQKNIGFISTLLFAAASSYFTYAGYSDYESYKKAKTSQEAVSFYDKAQQNDQYRNISLGVSLSSLIYYGLSKYNEKTNQRYYHEK